MAERGATEREVEEAIRTGERLTARRGLTAFRRNFEYGMEWNRNYHQIKQVMPVVPEEPDRFVVVTVYTFYF